MLKIVFLLLGLLGLIHRLIFKGLSTRTNFLNNLASKQIDYNLGAGVPPLNLYPELNLGSLFGEDKIPFNSKFINYHETQGFIIKEASVFLKNLEPFLQASLVNLKAGQLAKSVYLKNKLKKIKQFVK